MRSVSVKEKALLIIFSPIFLVLNFLFFRKVIFTQQPRSILVIESHRVGDVVVSLHLVRILLSAYPEAKLTYLGPRIAATLVASFQESIDVATADFPWSDDTASYGCFFLRLLTIRRLLRDTNFDFSIDCRGDLRNALMGAMFRVKVRIGWDGYYGFMLSNSRIKPSAWTNLYSNVYDVGKYFLGCYDSKNFNDGIPLFETDKLPEGEVAFCLGASREIRNVPVTEAAKIIRYLLKLNFRVKVFFEPRYLAYVAELKALVSSADPIQLAFLSLSFKEFFACLIRFQRVVAMDSGAAHLAMASGARVYVIHGPTKSPRIWPPVNSIVPISTSSKLGCNPCEKDRCVSKINKACMYNLNLRLISDER